MGKKIGSVIVVGGSAAGLAAALKLAEQGIRVRVLEKDPGGVPDTNVEAFLDWDRTGSPQVRTSHGFLARLRNTLKNDFPEIYADLLKEGAYDFPMKDIWPPTIPESERDVQPGDEELCMLSCRRLTLDWVMRRHCDQHPLIEVTSGVKVAGIIAENDASGLKRVAGVWAGAKGAEPEPLRADLVVDAAGRRSPLPQWCEDAAIPAPRVESEHCGIYLCSRFYRLLPGQSEPAEASGFQGIDLGYMFGLLVRGDSGIFSIMTSTQKDDVEFKSLMKAEVFDAAVRAIPMLAPWVDPARSEPITPVKGFGDLHNSRRFFRTEDGEPIALGIVAVGDSYMHTNPGFGRGIVQACLHALMLTEAVTNCGGDLRKLALDYEAANDKELVRWYKQAVKADRQSQPYRLAVARGEIDPSKREAPEPGAKMDSREMMRSLVTEGFAVAARTDPMVFRAMMRSYNLLDAPDAVMKNKDVLARIMKVWQERGSRRPMSPGPGRAEMLEILKSVAA